MANKNIKVRTTEKLKILIADDDRQMSRRLTDYLNHHGFDARAVYTGQEAKVSIVNFKPNLVLADLMLPRFNAFELLRFIKSQPQLLKRQIGLIVLSGHNDTHNVREAFNRGARDYVQKPISYPDLLSRIVLHCRQPRELAPVTEQELSAHWHMTELLLEQALQPLPIEDILYNLVLMANKRLKGVRCSILRTITHAQGVVVASSDDKRVRNLPINLMKYPEVQLVINTGKMIAIENLANSRALKKIIAEFKNISFNSLIVCPIFYRHKPFGVLSMRMGTSKRKLLDEEIRFVDVVAKVASLAISSREIGEMSQFGLISA